MTKRIRTQEIDQRLQKGAAAAKQVHERNREVSRAVTSLLGVRDVDKLQEIISGSDTNFAEARKNKEIMEGNIAILIHGLSEVTDSFGSEFKSMSETTFGERVIGIFSKKAAAAKRSDRIRSADLTTNLESLIAKSDQIVTMLTTDRDQLQSDKLEITEREAQIRREVEEVAAERVAVEVELRRLESEREAVQSRLRDATGVEKVSIETEDSQMVSLINEANGKLVTLTALAQSLERYSNQFRNHLTSLDTQIAAQNTLIDKITLDTKQRTLLYRSLTQALKTSGQQEVAHQINSIGTETDANAEAIMSNIGRASSNHIADMLETHKDYIRRSEELSATTREQQEEFMARYAGVIQDMEGRKLFLAEG